LKAGLEPVEPVAPVIAADAFRAVAEDWLKRDQAENRTHNEVRRVINKHVLPIIGDLPVAAITRRQLSNLIDDIADRGTVTLARRCHAYLHRMFRWSVGRGIIETSPMAYLPKSGAEVKRKRVLSDAKLGLAWDAAQEIGWPMGSAIQLLILTCARRDEIGALEWHEIDPSGHKIRLEGERTKNGEEHIIPLSSVAQKLIKALPRIAESKFVFTTTGKTPVSGWSRTKEKLDELMLSQLKAHGRDDGSRGIELKPWRIHDLRRTAATGMERLGIKQQVVEALLGHTAGSKAGITGIYQLHTYEEEKRDAIDRWTKHVASLIRAGRRSDIREPEFLVS
jgi:integrase